MKPCPNCGKELPEELNFCPYCMTKLIPEQKYIPRQGINQKKRKKLRWFFLAGGAAIIGIAVILVMVFLFPKGKESDSVVGGDILSSEGGTSSEDGGVSSEKTAEVSSEKESVVSHHRPESQPGQEDVSVSSRNTSSTVVSSSPPLPPPSSNPQKVEASSNVQPDYSKYKGTWHGKQDNLSYTLTVDSISVSSASGTLKVYDSVTQQTATVQFNGKMESNLIRYEYSSDGIGNAGILYLNFEETSIRLANTEMGWNEDAPFHWSTYSDVILSK